MFINDISSALEHIAINILNAKFQETAANNMKT